MQATLMQQAMVRYPTIKALAAEFQATSQAHINHCYQHADKVRNGAPTVRALMDGYTARLESREKAHAGIMYIIAAMISAIVSKGDKGSAPTRQEIEDAATAMTFKAYNSGITMVAVSAFFGRLRQGEFPDAIKWLSPMNVAGAFGPYAKSIFAEEGRVRQQMKIKDEKPSTANLGWEHQPITYAEIARIRGWDEDQSVQQAKIAREAVMEKIREYEDRGEPVPLYLKQRI